MRLNEFGILINWITNNFLVICIRMFIVIISINNIFYVFESSCEKKKIKYFTIFEFIILLITTIILPNKFVSFINILIIPILLKVLFKLSYIKICIVESFLVFIVGFSNLFGFYLYNLIFWKFNNTQNLNEYICCIIIELVELISIILVCLILEKTKCRIQNIDNINKIKSKRFVIEVIMDIIIMILMVIQSFTVSGVLNIGISLFCFLGVSYLVSNEIIKIINEVKLKNSYEKIENLENYNKTLKVLYDELSGFRHDFNNILQTIGGFLTIEKYDSLKQYYKELMSDCQIFNDIETLNPEMINNTGIYTVLVNKYNLAKQNGVRLNVEINSDLRDLNIKIFELTRILGILLDNAIEAAKVCTNKFLSIQFRDENNKKYIIIENSYLNKDVDINNIFKKGFSTKKGNTGLGLWKVNDILSKNTNLKLFTSKNEDLFVQKLEIINNSLQLIKK